MKFKIASKPSPLRQLDNIKQLKSVLKPIKTDADGKFLNALMQHCGILNKCIGKDFSLSDHDYIDLRCDVFFNIPLVSSATIGSGSNSFLQEYEKSGVGTTFMEKKDLAQFLHGTESLPSTIVPVKLEFSQKIGDAKSKFVYELVG